MLLATGVVLSRWQATASGARSHGRVAPGHFLWAVDFLWSKDTHRGIVSMGVPVIGHDLCYGPSRPICSFVPAGLALTAALLAVHLDHLHPGAAQVPGQASPLRARAFHPHPGHRPEASHPFQQLLVAFYGRGERLDAQ
jgi:hypothetical protein